MTFREMGCVIGSKVRFIDDRKTDTRTIKTDAQLDYDHILPWIVVELRPEKESKPKGVLRTSFHHELKETTAMCTLQEPTQRPVKLKDMEPLERLKIFEANNEGLPLQVYQAFDGWRDRCTRKIGLNPDACYRIKPSEPVQDPKVYLEYTPAREHAEELLEFVRYVSDGTWGDLRAKALVAKIDQKKP